MSYKTFMMDMFNKKAASDENKPDQILEHLRIKQGDYIADLGAGGGYFAARFSQIVGPAGHVYALDTNEKNLTILQQRFAEQQLENISTNLIRNSYVDLPEDSVDLLFSRNVFHHISDPVTFFKNLKPILKKNGHIAIIDYTEKNGFSYGAIFKHFTPESTIIDSLYDAGFRVDKHYNFLNEQSFNVFVLAT